MKYMNRAIGAKGELDAEKYLSKKGMKILAKNYSNKLGEIDIIAQDRDYIVFVEVKERSSLLFSSPCEAVTYSKQRKIRNAAQCYLKEKYITDAPCRFDVVEILGDEINYIEDAF